jgi:hypothetical protein
VKAIIVKFAITAMFVAGIFGGVYANQIIYAKSDYISVGVHDLSGRFFVQTARGDPDLPNDDNRVILFKNNPPTSFTVFKIDDLVTIYGSADGYYSIRPTNCNGKILTEWNIRSLAIRQYVEIVEGPTTGRLDTLHVYYIIENTITSPRQVGTEIVFDVYSGDRDGILCSLPDGTIVDRNACTTARTFLGIGIPLRTSAGGRSACRERS